MVLLGVKPRADGPVRRRLGARDDDVAVVDGVDRHVDPIHRSYLPEWQAEIGDEEHWMLTARPTLKRPHTLRVVACLILIGMRRTERFPVPELNAVASEVGWNPFASVYMSETRNRIIVCPMTSPEKGHYVEAEPIATIPFKSAPSELGEAVWKALLKFRSSANLGSPKKTDWPAFRVSGARSVRAFEDEFVRVSVEAFPCFLRIEAAVPCKAADGLFVGRFITNACEFEDLGSLLHQTSRCSLQVMAQEFG